MNPQQRRVALDRQQSAGSGQRAASRPTAERREPSHRHLPRPRPDARRRLRLGRLDRRPPRRARRAASSTPAPGSRAGRGVGRAAALIDLRPHILFPGLVDTHAHVPQLPICGVHPENLLEWLRKWTFPLERRFRGERALDALARRSCTRCWCRARRPPALYTSAWPDSVEACFDGGRGGRHPRLDWPAAHGRRRVSPRDDQARAGRGPRARAARSAEAPVRGHAALRALVHARAARRLRRARPREEPPHPDASRRAAGRVPGGARAVRPGVSRRVRGGRPGHAAQPVRARHLADRRASGSAWRRAPSRTARRRTSFSAAG